MSREVRDQFGPSARAYVTSAVHARGADLERLVELGELRGDEVFLDLATGAGHALRAFAPRVRRAIGLDATPEMLAAARALLASDGLRNARLVQADVTALPIAAASVDLVACRIAAHHFADVRAAFAEAARVLRPRGRFLLVDNYAPEDPALDRFVNALEALRDATHVREHRLSEWERLMRGAGLRCEVAASFDTPIAVEEWLARARTPPDRAASVRRMLAEASPEARRVFAIRDESFTLHKAILVGRKPGGP